MSSVSESTPQHEPASESAPETATSTQAEPQASQHPTSVQIGGVSVAQHPHLQVDDDDDVPPPEGQVFDSGDSAYGESLAETSQSLASSVTSYQYENGRRYHAYKEGEYYLPNDDAEQARLDLQHHIYRLCLAGNLLACPVKDPRAVLDLGTGTGIWAIDFADEHPEAVVYGTDLSPIQPGFIPPNVKFYVDDFEMQWEFPEIDGGFDFIHWRSLSGSTGDWPRLYGQVKRNLKTGGWLEVQEYDAWIFSDDDVELEKAPRTLEWCQTLSEMSVKFGKPLNVGRFHKQWMQDAGFVDVQEKIVKVPLGPWTRDPSLKELGRYERWHMNESVEAHSMALYTRVLGHTEQQAKIIFELVTQEFNDKSLHLYTVYRFIYGRKA